MNLTINGMEYEVGFSSLSRSFRREYKYRITTEDGTLAYEVLAVYADFTLSLLAVEQGEYDRLMTAISTCRGEVTVTLPDGQHSQKTYTGLFDTVEDGVLMENDDGVFWDNLTLSFTGTTPMEAGGLW